MPHFKLRTSNIFKKITAPKNGGRAYLALSILRPAFARGFTLLEMVMAMGLFSMVITTVVGIMLALNQAQVKAQNMQNIQDNIRFAVESMTKELRTGTNFVPTACDAYGCTAISFIRQDGTTNVGYCLNDGAIKRFIVGQATCSVGAFAVTSPEVRINKLYFYVTGQNPGPSDGQPRVTVVVSARSVNPTLKLDTTFDLQTTVTARLRDS